MHRDRRLHPSTSLLTVFLVLGGAVAAAPGASASPVGRTASTSVQSSAAVVAVRDTVVSPAHSKTSYAARKNLRVAQGAMALLAFQIPSSTGGAITSATLCFTTSRSSTGRITAFTSSNSWSNRTTWATRPAPQGRVVGSTDLKLPKGRETCIPVDASLLRDGTGVSFRLTAAGGTSYLGSRESASASVLRLTRSAPRTDTPPVPTPAIKPTTPAKPSTPAPTPTPTPTSPVSSSVDASTTQAFKPRTGFLGATSEFRRNVSTAPLNSDSDGLVANLASQVSTRYGGTAAFNVNNYTTTFYTATPSTPRRNVIYDNCQGKAYVPSQLYASGGTFVDVPIPAQAVAAAGTDSELSVWDPTTDQLWEFWKANKQIDGWHACWGGRIDSFSTNPGFFPGTMGAAASGLSIAAGTVGIAEMQAGEIDHAMSLAVVNAANWRTFSYPAQRSDGADALGAAHAIPEGLRFRLDPTVDVSTLRLTPIARTIATAAQKYGFVVSDKGGAVAVFGESGTGTSSATGSNPWTGLMQGVASSSLMRNFPWNRLQALPMDYGKP